MTDDPTSHLDGGPCPGAFDPTDSPGHDVPDIALGFADGGRMQP